MDVAKFWPYLVAAMLLCACGWLLANNISYGISAIAIVAVTAAIGVKRDYLNRVVREIGLVEAHVRQIGAGHIGAASPSIGSPELSKLRNALDGMAHRINATVEDLQDAANRDPLTGLPNRTLFRRSVERQLRSSGAQESINCLYFIDIDDFKEVNDTLGHNIGDQLLRLAADRLRLAVRLTDQKVSDEVQGKNASENLNIARFGGDEFTIFLPNIDSEAIARKIGARLQRVLSETFELGACSIAASASIGAAIAPRDGCKHDELLRAADTAMYHAKRQGGGRVEFYSSEFDEELRRLTEREQELRQALANDEFELFFQPLYDCRTLEISSAEALIRWRHPRHGLIQPNDFIPLAEKSNLIDQIGEWVIAQAADQIVTLANDGFPIKISINVSPNQLRNMEFIALVKASLTRTGADPGLFELEVTESVAMQDVALASERLSHIRDLGVSVAIDDFGTGYSNLASLIQMPIARLKLDKSLLQDVTIRPEARTLVQTIIIMAQNLNLVSVAEGVETQEELDLLVEMGCDVVQGFLLSEPVDEPSLRSLLNKSNPARTINHNTTNSA